MAYQTGNIRYKGSFKSIRHYRNVHDKKMYAGEKGGAPREIILKSPVFARTRENMVEFKGCGVAVKSIRQGLYKLLPEHADTRFTSRLVALIKKINQKDELGYRGRRAINISLNKPMLKTLVLHEKRKIDHQSRRCISSSHSESRTEATLAIKGLNPGSHIVPGDAQYYRVVNHISVISNYEYVPNNRKYISMDANDRMYAIAYSDYTPVNTPLTATVTAAFKAGTILPETVTVMQCVGIQFYDKSGVDEYSPYSSGSMMIYDVY